MISPIQIALLVITAGLLLSSTDAVTKDRADRQCARKNPNSNPCIVYCVDNSFGNDRLMGLCYQGACKCIQRPRSTTTTTTTTTTRRPPTPTTTPRTTTTTRRIPTPTTTPKTTTTSKTITTTEREIGNETVVPCQNKVDLIFVLDSSGSIGADNYKLAKDFVAKLVDAFGNPADHRVGFIIFSHLSSLVFPLTTPPNYNNMALTTLAKDAQYLGSVTKPWLAIDQAVKEFGQPRDGVPQNLVVITDGRSSNKSLTLEAADKAKLKGLGMFSVGVGSSLDDDELKALAGGISGRIFKTSEFPRLKELLKPTSQAGCNTETEKIPVPCDEKKHDLLILLDSSGSIKAEMYGYAKKFVAGILTAFSDPTYHRVGLILFGTNIQMIFPLTSPPNYKGKSLEDLVNSAPYLGTGTETDKALDAAINEFKGTNGAVNSNLLVITDGDSYNPAKTQAAAARAKSAGLRMFALGVGDSIKPDELTTLAGGDKNRVFRAENFPKLDKLLHTLSLRICNDQ